MKRSVKVVPFPFTATVNGKKYDYTVNVPAKLKGDLLLLDTAVKQVKAHYEWIWKDSSNLPQADRIIALRRVHAAHKPASSEEATTKFISRWLRAHKIVRRNRKAASHGRAPKVTVGTGFRIAKAYWFGKRYIVAIIAK